MLGWEPSIKLADGLARTYAWIKAELDKEAAAGGDLSVYKSSTIVAVRAHAPLRNPEEMYAFIIAFPFRLGHSMQELTVCVCGVGSPIHRRRLAR